MVKTSFPPKIKNKARCPLSAQLFSIELQILTSSIKQETKVNCRCIKKKGRTVTICRRFGLRDAHPQGIIIKLLRVNMWVSWDINTACKNDHISIYSQWTCGNQIKIIFVRVQRNEILVYNNVCQNYKTLMKAIKGSLSEWRDIPC